MPRAGLKAPMAAGLLFAVAGCLPITATPPAPMGYAPAPHQVPAAYPPASAYAPPVYQPQPYQPSSLGPVVGAQSEPMPPVGGPAVSPQVRYLPAPQPAPSMLGPPAGSQANYLPAPQPSGSLLGPQRAGWR